MGKQNGMSKGATSDDRIYPIIILQSNLKLLRKICNLSMKEFGNKVGVTGQTIANLENGDNNMSVMCYGSVMYFLECVASYDNGILDRAAQEGIMEALKIIPGLNTKKAAELEKKISEASKDSSFEDAFCIEVDRIHTSIERIYDSIQCQRTGIDPKRRASSIARRLLEYDPMRELYTMNSDVNR